MLVSEADVRSLLDPGALLDALEDGFRALAAGEVQSPPRPQITVPGAGFSLAMSGWRLEARHLRQGRQRLRDHIASFIDGQAIAEYPLARRRLERSVLGKPRAPVLGAWWIPAQRMACSLAGNAGWTGTISNLFGDVSHHGARPVTVPWEPRRRKDDRHGCRCCRGGGAVHCRPA